MTTVSKLKLASEFKALTTREGGRLAFEEVCARLEVDGEIELDFEGVSPTPSFADECIGGLAAALGLQNFKERVHVSNVPADAKSLIRQVVLRRSR